MGLSFRFLVLVLLFCDCNGQLSLRTAEPIIAGRPVVLYCHIPGFSGVAQWIRSDVQFYVTQCDNTGFCSSITEGSEYSYSSNATGMLATINNIGRTEQKTWTCSYGTDDPVSYSISYGDNVFVIPSSVNVEGIEQNTTIGNDGLQLVFTTSCMYPEPEVRLYYTMNNRNVTITTKTESVNTSGSCVAPESIFEGSMMVSSTDACSVSVVPKLLVAPVGLSFLYTTTEWSSANYINFPTCQVVETNRLTTDSAFGYSMMFSIIGLIIASVLAVVIYKVLLTTGKMSFVVLEATEKLNVKMKLFAISVLLTLILCMIIAAMVVVAECGSKCFTVGNSAAFIVLGIAVHMVIVCLVVYVFVRCCNKVKDGVKKMEEDHMSDHGGKSGRATVTPSAIDIKTTFNYSTKHVHIEQDNFMSSEDLRKSRSFSETTDESFDLRTDRSHSEIPSTLNKTDSPEKSQIVVSKSAPDSTQEAKLPNLERAVPIQKEDSALEISDNSKQNVRNSTKKNVNSKIPSESSRSSSTTYSNRVTPYTDVNNDNQQESSREVLQKNEKETNDQVQDSQSLSSHGSNHGYMEHRSDPIRSISGRVSQRQTRLSPTNDYVKKFSSDNQSKVVVMPEDSASCIISVPTGDGLELEVAESSVSSGDDEQVLQNPDSKSKGKKTSKKKRSKKKKWRKKKTVAPEQTENIEIVKSKPKKLKSKSKKKKEKIIV